MADQTLAVVPAGLLAAAHVIAGQAAALRIPGGRSGDEAEPSAAAAARLSRALHDCCDGLSRRLTAVSHELETAAGRYTGTDAEAGAVLGAVAPVGQR
ncbi:hypothetical protein E2F47_00965 [Mycobacterium eburneum]|nr:hypothetical protein [Mycobacterium eburneum]TDH57766.1 hypothetical protein E2F47_00965 [Mycobacterium eburneum]